MTERRPYASGVTPTFVVVAALFITCLIASNIIAVKLVSILGHVLPAAIIIFPLSYIIGDILTEVYGFRYARAVIWLGFLCNLIAVAAFWGGGLLPQASNWEHENAYDIILGYTPRLLGASFAAYLVGELVNSALLAKMKVWTQGQWLWSRTIGSTVVGQGLDSLVFITLAFVGTVPDNLIIRLILTQWTAKVIYETGVTPLTYLVIGWLKRREGVDHYDRDTSLNPFPLFR
ncbi:MAG: queuosine precursor transporter [Chloroflexi bacterium]|nr:queuosine precursor transporter [Chloroflexota bacterium]